MEGQKSTMGYAIEMCLKTRRAQLKNGTDVAAMHLQPFRFWNSHVTEVSLPHGDFRSGTATLCHMDPEGITNFRWEF
jgi:hypothetical protein